MELWIRSQDREMLQIVETIYLDGEKGKKIYSGKSIDGYKIGFCLGKYKSKERALEVLDEIQKNIRSKYTISLKPERAFDGVYEMPEE